jgi:hypothetical protein
MSEARSFGSSAASLPRLRESVAGNLATGGCKNCEQEMQEFRLIPHDQPGGPLFANLAAFWQQISPTMPVLPTVPAHKSCAVYILAFEAFHGMEDIIGSIPIR